MREEISCLISERARGKGIRRTATGFFSSDQAKAARSFHQNFPEYTPTPLVRMPALADSLGVADIWVKDESHRFGLKAFKVLGATYGIAFALAGRFGLSAGEVLFDTFRDRGFGEQLKSTTFVTATDGNHGRAVAWAAERLGSRAVVYMPRGTAAARYENVRAHGAKAVLIEGSYDEAVALASAEADSKGWVLVQDTAGPGYEDIPRRIMQGYLTLMDEVLEQLSLEGHRKKQDGVLTHLFVQCGVGSFAGALEAYLVEVYGDSRPFFTVVEPNGAACFLRSRAASPDGEPVNIDGEIYTCMAGLACGRPSTIAWEILRDHADAFVSCPDRVAEMGMRLLAAPPVGDAPIVSGESGAVTAGLLAEVMGRRENKALANLLGLDSRSRVLLISTEGDTDPVSYKNILSRADEQTIPPEC